jgi:hypothetical protein
MRYSPYFRSADACIRRLPGGFTGVTVRRAGLVTIGFDLRAASAARALVGRSPRCE